MKKFAKLIKTSAFGTLIAAAAVMANPAAAELPDVGNKVIINYFTDWSSVTSFCASRNCVDISFGNGFYVVVWKV